MKFRKSDSAAASHFLLQQMDYLSFIDIYKDYIKAFHVKDAEFNPTGNPVFMEVIRAGLTDRDVSDLWATDRSIFRESLPSLVNMISIAGQC